MTSINTVLNKYQQVTYSTYLFFGSNSINAELLVDTGTGWIAIADISCKTCKKGVYNPLNSTSSHSVNTGRTTLDYGSRTMWGNTYVD